MTIIYLVRLSPAASSDLPESRPGRSIALCLVLLRMGLHGSVCYQPDGSLLHCLSTLTGQKPAVYLCCTSLGVTSTRRYLASCPVKPGLSSPAAFRFCSRDHLSYSKHSNSTIFSGICPVNHTLKQLPPINSRTIELCGTCSLLTPRK